jgi:UDP-N-acetylmuramate dehydrogenase
MLAPFTTLGIGGPARYFIHANTENTVREAIAFATSEGLPLFVLGGGSNLVIADSGYPGVVLRIEIRGIDWTEDDDVIRLAAGAGEDWDPVVAESVSRRLFGVECLSGIPGSVGGTPVQNVGAYGQEISETLIRVRAFDSDTNAIVEIDRADCGFAYRSSIFNTTHAGRYIVLRVEYALRKRGPASIRYAELQREFENVAEPAPMDVREAVLRVRARKAMVIQRGDPDCRSVGSFFKNPIVNEETIIRLEAISGEKPPRYPAIGGIKTAAAWLIERSGVKRGFSIGSAGVSTKHTLALVNKGNATALELIALAREIRKRVEDRFGIRLVVEPVFVGFDDEISSEFRH